QRRREGRARDDAVDAGGDCARTQRAEARHGHKPGPEHRQVGAPPAERGGQRGSGTIATCPVANTWGHTVTLWFTPCHCQTTLAARRFCPRSPAAEEKRSPPPLGRRP